jgi:hypothetical protein
MKTSHVFILAVIATILMATGVAFLGPKAQANTVTEFVCEDDGKLVERHVGVRTAHRYDDNVWGITYVDGPTKFYHQPTGETCGTEAYQP